MNESTYLPHLHDSFRREIAVTYVRHELRKLFPSVRDENFWKTLGRDVSAWFDESPLVCPVRDFWNAVNSFSHGIRLKHIVQWLTSLNILWERKELAIDTIYFGTLLHDLKHFDEPLSGAGVREWYFNPEHRNQLEEQIGRGDMFSQQSSLRDDDPVLVIRRDGTLVVSDGNRRLLRSIILGRDTIEAYVGEPIGEPVFSEHWVPTSVLLDMVGGHRYAAQADRRVTEPFARVIVELIRDSSAGRYEFVHRSIRHNDEHDQRLFDAVSRKLKMFEIIV